MAGGKAIGATAVAAVALTLRCAGAADAACTDDVAARPGVAGIVATTAGNCTAPAHSRPSTLCAATSHHSRQRVAAGRVGSQRHSAQISATSTSVCTLVASRRDSRLSNTSVPNRLCMAQSSRRCDCSLATRASSSASSASLTSARCDIHATNGETEPCRVFSTKLPTALRTTSSWPLVAA